MPADRLSYTITMRSIIPACEALARGSCKSLLHRDAHCPNMRATFDQPLNEVIART